MNETICSICFEDLNLHTQYSTHCNHIFHKKCLNIWINKNTSCPICRTTITDDLSRKFTFKHSKPNYNITIVASYPIETEDSLKKDEFKEDFQNFLRNIKIHLINSRYKNLKVEFKLN